MPPRGDGLPTWPTIVSMVAAGTAATVVCTARFFGWMKPRCVLCETTELGRKNVVGGQRLCAGCFASLR